MIVCKRRVRHDPREFLVDRYDSAAAANEEKNVFQKK